VLFGFELDQSALSAYGFWRWRLFRLPTGFLSVDSSLSFASSFRFDRDAARVRVGFLEHCLTFDFKLQDGALDSSISVGKSHLHAQARGRFVYQSIALSAGSVGRCSDEKAWPRQESQRPNAHA